MRIHEFSPNSRESFLVILTPGWLSVIDGDATGETIFSAEAPWLAEDIPEVQSDFQVDTLYLTHGFHEPRILTYVGGETLFTFGKLREDPLWKSDPFQKQDTSGTELQITVTDNRVRLVSTQPDEFDWALALNMSTESWYVEMRIKNNWALYRLADGSEWRDG